MKLLKIGIYNEELYADFVDYIEALPKSVKTGTVMARLIAWYMQQPGDFKKQFEYLPDKSKGGRRKGSRDSEPRTRRKNSN